MTKLLCCFVFSAIALLADVTGTWSGTGKGTTSDGDTQTMVLTMELKQTGNEITGAVITHESGDRYTLAGTIDGDSLNFKVQANETTYVVKLTVKDDRMTGEANAEQGAAKVNVKLEFKRGS